MNFTTPADDVGPTLRAFFLGVSDGIQGLASGVTYDDDPESERSRAYDLGRNAAEGREVSA